MMICEVIDNVWATKKDENLNGLKLMVVKNNDSSNLLSFVAVDIVGAGIGERVLVVTGSTARLSIQRGEAPVDAAIIGIIDSVEV